MRFERIKIVILGKTVQVGWELQRSMALPGEVIAYRDHTMLEAQIYRALKELRLQQGWRLEQIAIEPPPPRGTVG